MASDTSNKPIVRPAVETDVAAILSLIKELAGFEKSADQVLATEDMLRNTITFPTSKESRVAYCFMLTVPPSSSTADTSNSAPGPEDRPLLTPDGKEEIAGFAVYFFDYSTWLAAPSIYLEDLFVRPRFRRQGFATMLLSRLAKEVLRVNPTTGRLKWNCLRWNENALKFYKQIGGETMDAWVGIRVQGQAKLSHLASLSP